MNDIRPVSSVSVVVPAYRSERTLPALVAELERVLPAVAARWDIVIIDDGSPDGTWRVLKELKAARPALKIARLLRNSGQHNALLCGLALATGDIVVTMDDDLQHPPAEIPKLLAAVATGHDLVIGAYDQKQHSAGRNAGGGLVDALLRRIFHLPDRFQLTSFRAIRAPLARQVAAMRVTFPYVTAMLLTHAGRCVNVPVVHRPRTEGRSGYTLRRSVGLAFNLVLNYSAYPVYLVIALGLGALTCSAVLGGWACWKVWFGGGSLPGWASTIVAISFFNGLLLLAMVIQGLYLSRLTQQVSGARVSFSIGELHE